VLHAFTKKARKTPKRDIDLAGERFRAVIEGVKDKADEKASQDGPWKRKCVRTWDFPEEQARNLRCARRS